MEYNQKKSNIQTISKDQINKIFEVGFKKKFLLKNLLENELSNWRWAEQNEIISVTDQLLYQLIEKIPKKPLIELKKDERILWYALKAELLHLIGSEIFIKRIDQPEYLGWRSLIKQIKDILEQN